MIDEEQRKVIKSTGIHYFIPPLSITLNKSDYCNYEGECRRHQSQQEFLCYVCKYLKKIDIPSMLDEKYNEYFEETEKRNG